MNGSTKCGVDTHLKNMYFKEYYSVLKRKEILTYAITWMNLEDVLSERSQSSKDKCCTAPLIRSTQSSYIIRKIESRMRGF